MPEARQDLALENSPVLGGCRRPQRRSARGKPLLGVLAERDRDRRRPAPLAASKLELHLRFPSLRLLGASVALPPHAPVARAVLDVVARHAVLAGNALHDARHRSTSSFARA